MLRSNNKQAIELYEDCKWGQTDRQTDARPFHRLCSAFYAVSVNKLMQTAAG